MPIEPRQDKPNAFKRRAMHAVGTLGMGIAVAVLPPAALAQSVATHSPELDKASADFELAGTMRPVLAPTSAVGPTIETSGEQQGAPEDSAYTTRPLVREGRDFTVIVSPYVWIPTVTGDIGIGAQGFQFDLDAGDLLDVFEFGGLIRGEVRHKSGWGVSVDHIFADLGTGVDIVIGDVTADIDAGITELAVVRRLDLGEHALDLYGGVRIWNADLNVEIETVFFDDTIQTGDNWTDPMVGVRYLHTLSPKWRLIGQADIGGFGAGSDFSWNVAAGASYDLSRKASLQLVYRALSVDRQSPGLGGGEPVGLDITIQGPLIGFAYRF